MIVILLKRRVVSAALLFLFFTACTSPRQCWEYTELHGNCYQTSRLVYAPPNTTLTNIEIEFVQGSEGIKAYLNFYACPLPGCEDDSCRSHVTIVIDNVSHEYLAYRFEGGQRLLLPGEATNAVMAALLEGKIVTISKGFYRSQIEPSNFGILYEKF